MTPSITSSKLAVLMVVGLLACSGLVSAGYPVRAKPYPIQTATAHIDHFVPNNVDRVEVVDFTVLNFGAAVLDFGLSFSLSFPFTFFLPIPTGSTSLTFFFFLYILMGTNRVVGLC
jgi:hypothetical protein